MKKTVLIIYSILCLISPSLTAQKITPSKKVIFIILDGISSDALEKVHTPNLDDISKAGGYTRAYVGGENGTHTETPTISAVGYNSLLTGTWVHKHNVWGNSIKNPNYNYWNLFRVVENYDSSLQTAIYSTWLDNRTKLIGEGIKNAGNIKLDYAFDGFEHDTIRFPHDKGNTYISKIDEHVSKEAERHITKNGPDLSWVYLEFTDDMGHMFGDSPQFHKAIKSADKQVGRIWNALKLRQEKFNEDWMIVVTTDHGRKKEDGKGHGGQSDRERATWIVTNQPTNSYFKNTPGVVDIMPSILNYLKIEMSKIQTNEIDGTSFINPISISNLHLQKVNKQIKLTWKSYGKNRKVKVYVSTTNNFKTGGKDTYKKVGSANSSDEIASFEVDKLPSELYKIVLKTKLNSLNKWIVIEK